jgi:hypothetical protein
LEKPEIHGTSLHLNPSDSKLLIAEPEASEPPASSTFASATLEVGLEGAQSFDQRTLGV